MEMIYLHRYTSISTLESIIENRSIRFSPLNIMDDIDEERTHGLDNMGKHCYVSCWMREEKEDPSFWRMYGDEGRGVRISLPIDPFIDKYKYSSDEKVNKGIIQMSDLKFMLDVQYTDDKSKLYPNIYGQGNYFYNWDELGLYKSTLWSNQKEFRYRLILLPFALKELTTLKTRDQFDQLLQNESVSTIESVNLEIRDDYFNNMKIMIGYNVDEKQYINLRQKIGKYAPELLINIKSSQLHIRN